MSSEHAIHVEGRVVAVLREALFQVELPNGHRLLAHVGRKDRDRKVGMIVGQNVTIRMSPYDLSSGRVVFEN